MLIGNENTYAFLAARRYLYVLFQSLFGNEPSEEQLAAIDNIIADQAFEEMDQKEAGANARFLTSLDGIELTDLKNEYTRLFIGPNKLKAPPWESMYTTQEQMLFQKSTLVIRNLYRSEGFIPAAYPRVADDHLAIELDFMAQLSQRMVNAHETDSRELAEKTLRVSLEFLQDHLLVWVPKYLADIEQTGGRFYPQACRSLLFFLKKDREGLQAIIPA